MNAERPQANAMSPVASPAESLTSASAATLDDCWNRIGVNGTGACEALPQHVHCRNCPVYGRAGLQLLSRQLPEDYRREWAAHYAQIKQRARPADTSVVVFRIGQEWLALDTEVFQEVAERRPVHSLPHRQQGAVLGLVNVRGELLICVSLARVLGLPNASSQEQLQPSPSNAPSATSPTPASSRNLAGQPHQRLLVVQADGRRFAFPVDQVHGTHRFNRADLQPPPASVALSPRPGSRGLFFWQNHTVAWLGWEALRCKLEKCLA